MLTRTILELCLLLGRVLRDAVDELIHAGASAVGRADGPAPQLSAPTSGLPGRLRDDLIAEAGSSVKPAEYR